MYELATVFDASIPVDKKMIHIRSEERERRRIICSRIRL
jgi:hypothetical protein